MSIDWFTFAAQLLNFALLVWLLKRFLYKPILDAIAAREKRISAELANAAEVEAEAKQQREHYQRNNAEFARQHEHLLAEARQKAQAEYERLVAEARNRSDALARKHMRDLQRSISNLEQAIGRRLQQQVFSISRKILTELAGESLEERMTATFVSRLNDLDTDAAMSLRSAVGAGSQEMLLRSAFELAQPQRDAIRSALSNICEADPRIHFETLPDLVSGIELIVNGHKIAWSISDYLKGLEKSLLELVPARDGEPRPAEDTDSGEPRQA